jgi:phytoene dehydrogenase-like protein
MDDFFDIIVVGPHLGGLLAAALLIKRGKKALLLSMPDQEDNDNWETDSNERIFTDLAGQWFLKKALDELAALPGRTILVKPLDPAFQLVMPGIRLDIRRDPDLLERLAEDFNEDPKEVVHLFGTLDKVKNALWRYFFIHAPHGRRGVKGLIRTGFRSIGLIPLHKARHERFGDLLSRYHFGSLFCTALMSQIMGFSRLYSFNPTLTSAAHCLSMVQNGAFGLGFERPSLASMLKTFIAERGGQIIPEAVVRKIIFTQKHVRAVYLEGKYEPFHCLNLLVNTDMRWFYERASEQMRDAEHINRIQEIQAAGFHYRLHFHIRRNVVPVGMAERVLIIVDPEKPLINDNFFTLVLGPHDDRYADPDDTRMLTLSCRIPLTPDNLNMKRMSELYKNVLRHLRALIPFLEHNIVHVSSSILPSTAPDRANKCPGQTWLFDSAFSPLMGLSLLPHTTPYPNVFLTGNEVLPGMGPDGMVIAGCFVADAISGRSTRFRP